jgi:hypothetical protein
MYLALLVFCGSLFLVAVVDIPGKTGQLAGQARIHAQNPVNTLGGIDVVHHAGTLPIHRVDVMGVGEDGPTGRSDLSGVGAGGVQRHGLEEITRSRGRRRQLG